MPMADLKVQQGQTIYDLAIQAYGSVEGVFQLIEDNDWLDLESTPTVGKKVVVKGDFIDEPTANYVDRYQVVPANGDGDNPFAGAFSDGYSDGFNTGE